MGNYMVFDIGGTSVKYACSDENANFRDKGKIEPVPNSLKELVEEMAQLCEKLCPKKPDGVAISSPGGVNPETGTVSGISMVPAIHEGSVMQALNKRLNVPVSVENDANCAALGEVWKGAAQDVSDALFVVIGSGIGGAVIRNKSLVRGSNLQAGEFGYMILNTENYMKTWSEVASVRSLVEQVKLKSEHEIALSGKEIFIKAKNGDKICHAAVEQFYKNLALGIYNLQYLFDPQAIFLGGAVSNDAELAQEVDKKIKAIFDYKNVPKLNVQLRACHFQGDANMVGALRWLLLSTGQ